MVQKGPNERQTAVLRWIADGCPDGVMADSSYKTSAVALQNRKLVRVRRTATSWNAELTDAGRRFLDDGTLLGPAGAPPQPSAPAPSRPAKTAAAKSRPDQGAQKARRAARELEGLAQRVVASIEGDGAFRWKRDDPQAPELHEVRTAVDRYGAIPVGKCLPMTGNSLREVTFVFKDAPVPKPLQAVPVPARPASLHPAAQRLSDDPDGLQSYDRGCRKRVLRIVHALATEAQRRGFEVRPRGRSTHNRFDPNLFYMTCHHAEVVVNIRQQRERRKHEPTAAERRRLEADPKAWVPKYDDIRSKRLYLRAEEGGRRWQKQWGDGPEARLEDCLGQVLQALALRRDELQLQEREEARKRQEKQRAWERAMTQAQASAATDFLKRAVDSQATAWSEAQQVRAYALALEAAAAGFADPEAAAEAAAWVIHARQRADELDPLCQPIRAPVVPTFSRDELQPFLRGWSAYGPW